MHLSVKVCYASRPGHLLWEPLVVAGYTYLPMAQAGLVYKIDKEVVVRNCIEEMRAQVDTVNANEKTSAEAILGKKREVCQWPHTVRALSCPFHALFHTVHSPSVYNVCHLSGHCPHTGELSVSGLCHTAFMHHKLSLALTGRTDS